MNEQQRIDILPFGKLLRLLRSNGFIIGIDTYLRLAEYWQEIATDPNLTEEILKAQLSSLLCSSEEQQLKFEQLYQVFLPKGIQSVHAAAGSEGQKPPTDTPTIPVEKHDRETELRPLSPEDFLQKPLPPIDGVGPVLPRLTFPEEPLRIWNLAEMGPALIPLQEKVWSDTTEWDVPRSIQAMIRAGGMPRLVFRRRKQAPRYLALIEQQGPNDHLASYAAELVKEINRRDLEAEYFFFDRNPGHLWKAEREPATHVSIERLKSEWSGARLLLMSPAAPFVDQTTGMPSNLALDLPDNFANVALLATNPNLDWGTDERSISSIMPVLPMSMEGLSRLMSAWNGAASPGIEDWQMQWPERRPPGFPKGYRPDAISEVLMDAYRYLGEEAFRWLCACAVYPELYFELTCILHDEAIPLDVDISEWQRNARWNKALRLLSRLEWFRRGDLPESLADELKKNLSADDRKLVDSEIRRILDLSKNKVVEGTYADERRREMYEWLAAEFRVLWIDDNQKNNLRYREKWTRELGITFRQATNSIGAADLLSAERFDLVISDLGRKNEQNTGLVTLELVKQRAPVIFFTDKRGLNLRTPLLQAGAQEVTNSAAVLQELLVDAWRKKFGVVAPPEPDLDFRDIPPEVMVEQRKKVTKRASRASNPYTRRDQEMLQQLGYYQGEITGLPGAELTAAIKEFQKSLGVKADGVMGPQTRGALEYSVVEKERPEAESAPAETSGSAPETEEAPQSAEPPPPESAQTESAQQATEDAPPALDSVYIEYGQPDKEQVHMVMKYIQTYDFNAMVDFKDMKPGEGIHEFIARAVSQSKAIIAIISAISFESLDFVSKLKSLFEVRNPEQLIIPCATDMRWMEGSFLEVVMNEMDQEISTLSLLMVTQTKNKPSFDETINSREQLLKLKKDLPTVIQQLQKYQVIDISKGQFERGMRQVLDLLRPRQYMA
jgi:CheY-like chemotaxis protein